MEIRILEQIEYLDGLHLAWKVFADTVISQYSHEAILEFQQMITKENIEKDCQNGEMFLWGAFDNDVMVGVSALDKEGCVRFLFVEKPDQKNEVGNEFFKEISTYASECLELSQLTAMVILDEIDEYKDLGFDIEESIITRKGMGFALLKQMIEPADMVTPHKELHSGFVVAGFIVALIVVTSCAVMISQIFEQHPTNSIIGENNTVAQAEEALESEEGNLTSPKADFAADADEALEAEKIEFNEEAFKNIHEHAGLDVPYYFEYDSYFEQAENHEKAKKVDIYVLYPVIKDLDAEITEKVDKILKDCALETANDIYINPSEAMTSFLDNSGREIISSLVQCVPTFTAKEICSVSFEDQYSMGNDYSTYFDLRASTIDLRTGSEVRLEDIVELDESAFYSLWIERLRQKNETLPMLDEIAIGDFKKLFKNEELPEEMKGRYFPVFYIQGKGLEIGFSYHYASDTVIARGWETALITWNDLAKYKTKSDVWNLIDAGLH